MCFSLFGQIGNLNNLKHVIGFLDNTDKARSIRNTRPTLFSQGFLNLFSKKRVFEENGLNKCVVNKFGIFLFFFTDGVVLSCQTALHGGSLLLRDVEYRIMFVFSVLISIHWLTRKYTEDTREGEGDLIPWSTKYIIVFMWILISQEN